MSIARQNRRDFHSHALSCTLDQLEPRALLAVSFDALPITAALPALALGNPQSIVAADFDGDGHIDLAVSFHDRASPQITNNGIAFYRGHADGSFDAAVWTPLAARAGDLAAVHFAGLALPNGGGMNLVSIGGVGGSSGLGFTRDFVRTYHLSLSTHMFVVESHLTLDPTARHAGDPIVTTRPGGPVFGDFTGDGRTDIAFALNVNGGRGIAILDHLSIGSLTLHRAIDTARITPAQAIFGAGVEDQPLTVGDLDADSRQDIVFRTVDSGFFALRNTASGITGSPLSLGFASNIDWRFADIDGDHRLDALSTWIPLNQSADGATQLFAFFRVKRGEGPGVGVYSGTLFFGALERLAIIPIGPRDPTNGGASAFGDGTIRDTLGFQIGPDLNNNGVGDVFIYRNYSAASRTTEFRYQRIETITALTAPAAAPWPDPVDSLVPDYQEGSGPFTVALGRGIPLLFDVNNDHSADLIQIVNGELEVRLNMGG